MLLHTSMLHAVLCGLAMQLAVLSAIDCWLCIHRMVSAWWRCFQRWQSRRVSSTKEGPTVWKQEVINKEGPIFKKISHGAPLRRRREGDSFCAAAKEKRHNGKLQRSGGADHR